MSAENWILPLKRSAQRKRATIDRLQRRLESVFIALKCQAATFFHIELERRGKKI